MRIANKTNNSLFLLAVRESDLNLVEGIAHIHSGIVNHIIHILDVADLLRSETPPAQSHQIYSGISERLTSAEHVRRNVLVDFGAAADHSVLADF